MKSEKAIITTEEKPKKETKNDGNTPPKRGPGRPRKNPPTEPSVPPATRSPAAPSAAGKDVRDGKSPKSPETGTNRETPPKMARSTKRVAVPRDGDKPAAPVGGTGGGSGSSDKPAADTDRTVLMVVGGILALGALWYLRSQHAAGVPSGSAEAPSAPSGAALSSIEAAWEQLKSEVVSILPNGTMTLGRQ